MRILEDMVGEYWDGQREYRKRVNKSLDDLEDAIGPLPAFEDRIRQAQKG